MGCIDSEPDQPSKASIDAEPDQPSKAFIDSEPDQPSKAFIDSEPDQPYLPEPISVLSPSYSGAGTDDCDWLLGAEEAKVVDNLQAAVEAENRQAFLVIVLQQRTGRVDAQ
jgi:hypothetical protein